MKTIVLTGGGTAGHIYPALALLPELYKFFDNVYYIGSDAMESKIVPTFGIPFKEITAVKLVRGEFISNTKIPYKLFKGIREASAHLDAIKPDLVFCKGGYVSLPVAIAASKKRIPIILHESDLTMGLANKIISRYADKILTSFEETAKDDGILVGNPIREEIFRGKPDIYRTKYNLSLKKTIMVTGGSLGAVALNNVIYECLPKLLEKYNVIHLSGKNGDFGIKYPNYAQLEYSNDIENIYALSDIIITRGGANTLAEVVALGKKAVIVPLPKGTSRGDQIDNAINYKKKGLVEVILQEDLSLLEVMEAIAKLEIMPNNKPKGCISNKRIVNEIMKTIKDAMSKS